MVIEVSTRHRALGLASPKIRGTSSGGPYINED